jgi:hypothetical protein
MGLFDNVCRSVKTDPVVRDLTFPLPPPTPTRKTFHNLPKKTSHQVFFSPMRWPRDRSHRQRPPTNQLYGPYRGFVTGSNKRPGVQTIRNTHLKPSCHHMGTTTVTYHKTNSSTTCVHSMYQDYPIAHPSPGVNPPISLPFLTPVRRGPSDVRIPKDMDFFPCHYTTFRVVQCRTTSQWLIPPYIGINPYISPAKRK